MYIHAVFKDKMKSLIHQYADDGLTPCIHGNKGKQPKHVLTVEDIENVVSFVYNYAEENAILLPGRIPGYKRNDLRLLPSSVSKAEVYRLFATSCEAVGHRVISERHS